MFSRLAVRSAPQKGVLNNFRQIQTTSTSSGPDGPERDVQNFPRPSRLLTNPRVRLGFIPDSWFKFLYPKTGVTGPYMLGIGLSTYLLSKEVYVLEHEYYTGLSIIVMAYIAVTKLGPPFSKFLDGEVDKMEQKLDEGRNQRLQSLAENVKEEQKEQWRAEGQLQLVDAKRENVALQLEAAYRSRLMTAYTEVKKRLDYQSEKENINRRITQKNLVEFVTQNVLKSISGQQEKEALKKCISDLNTLSASLK